MVVPQSVRNQDVDASDAGRVDPRLTTACRGVALLETIVMSKTLWTMRSGSHQLEAAIVWTERQWELRLLAHGRLITWRRFTRRSTAVAYADVFQQDLERAGWQ